MNPNNQPKIPPHLGGKSTIINTLSSVSGYQKKQLTITIHVNSYTVPPLWSTLSLPLQPSRATTLQLITKLGAAEKLKEGRSLGGVAWKSYIDIKPHTMALGHNNASLPVRLHPLYGPQWTAHMRFCLHRQTKQDRGRHLHRTDMSLRLTCPLVQATHIHDIMSVTAAFNLTMFFFMEHKLMWDSKKVSKLLLL